MLVKTLGSAVIGVDAFTITIEVSVESGGKYYMVGLPDNAVKESWHRIATALKHNGFKMPRIRIVVNLAPADIRKEGSAYDLPIAVGILAASHQVFNDNLHSMVIMGEISLDGGIQAIKGVLPMAIQAAKEGISQTIVFITNIEKTAFVPYNVNEIDKFFLRFG